MGPRPLLLACLVAFPGVVLSNDLRPGVSAVQKVIQMLTDMLTTAQQEKQREEVDFAKFSTWCAEEQVHLAREIKKNGEEMEVLSAGIGKLKSEVKELGDEIGALNNDVSTFEADSAAATSQREKDQAEFESESTDYSESVSALDRAIVVLQRENYDRPAASAALLQLSNSDPIPSKVKSIITAFLGMMDDKDDGDGFMGYQAPEANAYEAHTTNIIELLKRLQDQFRSKLGTCQTEEMNSKHAYNLVMTDLSDSIKYAKKDIEEKRIAKERKLEKAAIDSKQLAGTTALKEDNEKVLSDMKAECMEKKLSFDEKQELRADELEALTEAIKILSSPDVAGSADKHFSLMQSKPLTTMLIQVERSEAAEEGIRHRVREFIGAEAKRLNSQQLALLADKLAANPFAKVKRMIDDMITRLLEEANRDAVHEGFCDTEMGKSKITRNKLNGEIDQLDAAVEEGKATIMTLTKNIAEFNKEVEEIIKAMSEAADLRKEEHETNMATIKDAEAAQAAVTAATAVLKDFYKKASVATALVQGIPIGSPEWDSLANPDFKGTIDPGHKKGMQTFGRKFTGQQDEAGGIFALLSVVLSDFANLEADTKADEEASKKTFERNMVEWKRSKATKTRQIEMNSADKSAAEAKLRDDIADLKSTQDELLAAERYYERLVPKCVDQGMTFDEMMKARQSEIDSLKKALEILSSEDIDTSA